MYYDFSYSQQSGKLGKAALLNATDSAESRRTAFEAWCINICDNEPSYVNRMISILDGNQPRFGAISDFIPEVDSAFFCDDVESVELAYELATISPENIASHYQLSSAFKKYRDFLLRDNDVSLTTAHGSTVFVNLPKADVDDSTSDEPLETEETPYSDADFLSEVYMEPMDYEDLKSLATEKKNVILQGAPGTGKTFVAERLAWAIMGCKDKSRVEKVQFHQNTSYDEFVIGFRPNADGGFFIEEGPFVRFCNKAATDKGHREHFFIIDEINRANISKVFGELLMLIEDSHRGEALRLGIDGRLFSVPENVTIIGMMNTADRGLALIDYALRRRFAFFEMQPALDNREFKKRVEECEDKRMPSLVDAVRKLNKKIVDDPALGDGFRIGHSYFCKKKEAEPECVDSIIKYELIPLIKEYWFDDRKTADAEIAKLRSLQ